MYYLLLILIFIIFWSFLIRFCYLGLSIKPQPKLHKFLYNRIKINDHEYETLSLIHDKKKENLFLVQIPGNPGLIGFYEKFFCNLYEVFHQEINIIGASNRGLLNCSWFESLKNGIFFCEKFSLKDQVKHHMEFLQFLIKKHPKSKFIIMGHSLGSYFFIEMLKYLPKEKILKGILICPAIEHLSKSQKGIKLIYRISRQYKSFSYILAFLVSLFWLVPREIKKGMMSSKSKDYIILDNMIKLHDFNVALNYLNLGSESLIHVNEVNANIIKINQNKLWFLYTMYDEWVIFSNYVKMKNKFKKTHIYLDNGKISHAFMLNGSELTAQHIYNWIKYNKNIPNNYF